MTVKQLQQILEHFSPEDIVIFEIPNVETDSEFYCNPSPAGYGTLTGSDGVRTLVIHSETDLGEIIQELEVIKREEE